MVDLKETHAPNSVIHSPVTLCTPLQSTHYRAMVGTHGIVSGTSKKSTDRNDRVNQTEATDLQFSDSFAEHLERP